MAARPVVALLCVEMEGLAAYLERRGYDVRLVEESWGIEATLDRGGIDIAVLGLTANQAVEIVRQHGGGLPMILVCPAGDLIEKVLALELGAADVVEGPVSPRELAARIAGLLARTGRDPRHLVAFERSTVDLRSALVMHHSGEEELLSPGQIALLKLFLANPGKVLTRDGIMSGAPAESMDAFDRSIDSRIVRLRRRLDTESIATIRGAGYRFDPPA